MRSNKEQPTSGLEHYYMETDSLILINATLNPDLCPIRPPGEPKLKRVPFSNYQAIYKILYTHTKPITTDTKNLKIYDVTYNPPEKNNTIFSINDHINRIGSNPFIGNQNFFNIDFINVENVYKKKRNGVITTSYGDRYKKYKNKSIQPSTHIANIAVLAHIQNYTVSGYLVNQL